MQTKNHIEIFISYASQDEKLREELYMYLTSLQRNKPISFWSTYDMIAGRETSEQIRSHLNAAHIILLLVSSYSLSSDTIYQQQILPAMERARTEHVMLIPVLLRSISWKDEPFGKLPALPTNEVPITLWGNRDAAWDNVMQGIRQVIDTLLQSTPPQSALIAPVKEGTSPMANASSPAFDVFLCYNGQDRDAVKKIGLQLKDRGINPWLDVWELRPGLPWLPALEQQIANINSVAVFVGKGRVDERGKITALAPWQQIEANAALQEFVRRGCPVIPVVLEGAPEKPQLPLFLRAMHWIDFRKDDPDPLDQLAWGITGIQNAGDAAHPASPQPQPQPPAPAQPGLTPWERQTRQEQLTRLQNQRKPVAERLDRVSEAYDHETNEAIKVQQEYQMRKDKARLKELDDEINQIIRELQ